ncbi:MAG: hypothetical protein ACR2RL_02150 [Gammaproteobacteria bacterium]
MNEAPADNTTINPRTQNYLVDVLREAAYLGRHRARDVGIDAMRIEDTRLGLHEGDFIILEILPRGTDKRRCREARVCGTDPSGVTLRLLPSRNPAAAAREPERRARGERAAESVH